MGDVATASRTRPPLAAPPGRSVGGARRCLFGPPDREETARWQREQARERAGADRERWNFNFERGRPLPPGRYDWQPETEPEEAGELVQKRITDFMRKRKLTPAAEQKALPEGPSRKMSRRSST